MGFGNPPLATTWRWGHRRRHPELEPHSPPPLGSHPPTDKEHDPASLKFQSATPRDPLSRSAYRCAGRRPAPSKCPHSHAPPSRCSVRASCEIMFKWKLDLIQFNPPSHTSSILAAGANFGCHPNPEARPPARQRRLGKDRGLSVQTNFSALHEPPQQSSVWICMPSVRQTSSCITGT